jgi:hypothetical protein
MKFDLWGPNCAVDEAEGGGDGVQARPVYVAAVDLACKSSPFAQSVPDHGILCLLSALCSVGKLAYTSILFHITKKGTQLDRRMKCSS